MSTNEESAKHAQSIRLSVLEMANLSKSAHVGSALSCVDILTHLYFRLMQEGPEGDELRRDRFILSKGHAAMALYATLAERGVIPRSLLAGYMQEGGTLPAHVDRFACEGLEVSAGALGHGLPMGLGMAHGLKLRGCRSRVYVLLGDGECQEGSVWEAAMMAPALGVSNLTAIVDYNDLQGYGRPSEVVAFEPVADKWRAFGWHAVEVDGHDFESLERGFDDAAAQQEKPSVLIARTTKGKGVSFMEDELKWHYFVVTDELLSDARKEILDA